MRVPSREPQVWRPRFARRFARRGRHLFLGFLALNRLWAVEGEEKGRTGRTSAGEAGLTSLPPPSVPVKTLHQGQMCHWRAEASRRRSHTRTRPEGVCVLCVLCVCCVCVCSSNVVTPRCRRTSGIHVPMHNPSPLAEISAIN